MYDDPNDQVDAWINHARSLKPPHYLKASILWAVHENVGRSVLPKLQFAAAFATLVFGLSLGSTLAVTQAEAEPMVVHPVDQYFAMSETIAYNWLLQN